MGFACSLRARLLVADLPVAQARFNLRSLCLHSALRTTFEYKMANYPHTLSETQINNLIFLFLYYPITHVLMYTCVY